jgi:hypothetical protein
VLSVVGVSGLILLLWGFVRGGGIMGSRADAFGVRGRMRRQGPVDRFDESVGERDRIQPGEFTLDPGMRVPDLTDLSQVGSDAYGREAERVAERGGQREYSTSVEKEAARSRAETTRDLAILAIMLTSLPGGLKSAHAQPPIPYGGRGLIGGLDRWEARRRAGMFGNQPLTEGMGFAKPWRRPGWKSPQAIETERHMAPYRSILDSKLDSPAFEAARREIMRRHG